jgi:single-strand DNA-binding protein
MANFNFNKVIIGGRLTSDPELKNTPSGISVTSFTIAVNRGYKSKNGEETPADFINVTAWRQTAEFITKYFKKASSICVVGTLQNRNWTDNDGNKHYATEVVADEAYFVDAKGESSTAPSQQAPAPTTYIPAAYTDTVPQIPQFEEVTDEDLPF